MSFIAGYILGAVTTPLVAVAFIAFESWNDRRIVRKYDGPPDIVACGYCGLLNGHTRICPQSSGISDNK